MAKDKSRPMTGTKMTAEIPPKKEMPMGKGKGKPPKPKGGKPC